MLRRDDARTVLVAMARELGPAYLPFICEVLAAALPARGYTAHVLGHTVHAVVEGMHKVNVGKKTAHQIPGGSRDITCTGTRRPIYFVLCPGLWLAQVLGRELAYAIGLLT